MKVKIFSILFLLIIVISATAQSRPDFKLENITAKAGEKATGFIDVPKGVDDGAQIPVSVFHGARPGKILLVTAGIHGSEYAPVVALQRLAANIDPKKLIGTLVLVHVANPPAFFGRTIYYGRDGKNLNRVFPGKADGTITERIAYILTEKLMRRADYYIDVHSGDNNESLRPYVAYYESDTASREQVETGRRMAFASGFDFVKAIRGRTADFEASAYTTNAAFLLGKAAIAFESGELGAPQESDIRRNVDGLMNILRELEMLSDKKALKYKNQTIVASDQTIRSEHDGLFYSLVRRDQKVKKDEPLGYVTDFFGNRLQEVRAPFDGAVMYFTATPPISKGEPLVNLGEYEKQSKSKNKQ